MINHVGFWVPTSHVKLERKEEQNEVWTETWSWLSCRDVKLQICHPQWFSVSGFQGQICRIYPGGKTKMGVSSETLEERKQSRTTSEQVLRGRNSWGVWWTLIPLHRARGAWAWQHSFLSVALPYPSGTSHLWKETMFYFMNLWITHSCFFYYIMGSSWGSTSCFLGNKTLAYRATAKCTKAVSVKPIARSLGC